MRKMVAALLLAVSLGGLSLPAALAAEGESGLTVPAKAALLMERETGAVLWEQNAHEQLEPASVTKVMTMLLVAEAIEAGTLTLDELVTTSAAAAGMGGSQVYLEEGEQMTVDEMLKAVAVASGNDAAVALAEHLAGSEGAFAERMNRRAAELGMEDTHFVNCTGLPAEGHLTSAYDIALMSRELLRHEVIRRYTGIWMDTLRGGEFQLANTNKLIHSYRGATGLKTGSTSAAGFCIAASAERDGMELIAVILGAETSAERFDAARTLLDYGFGGWAMTEIVPEELPAEVPVRLGRAETVTAALERPARLLVTREELGQVAGAVTLSEEVEAPVRAGDTLGTLTVSIGEETVCELPLVAQEDVERLTFGDLFARMLRQLAMAS